MPVIPSPSTRTLAFIAGETGIYTSSATLLAEVKAKVPRRDLRGDLELPVHTVAHQPSMAPFSDARVRRAMALAIDREAVVKIKGAGLDRLAAN